MYLKIVNKGEIETAALTLLGASTKDGDSAMIGRFGSGNKYAIACLLREGIPFDIWSGSNRINISTKEVTFRDCTFQNIIIDGQETSLTTRTGPEWEPWMAIREFLCNAIDEGGFSKDEVAYSEGGTPGMTTIYIELTGKLASFAQDELPELLRTAPAIDTLDTCYGRVDILPAGDTPVYRKGIRAWTGSGAGMLFSYDFDDVEINESRIIPWDARVKERVASAFACTKNAEILRKLIRHYATVDPSDSSTFETTLYWNIGYCGDDLSETWKEVLIEANLPLISFALWQIIPADDRRRTLKLPNDLMDRVKETWPEIPRYGDFNKQLLRIKKPPRALASLVKEAKEKLKEFGIPVSIPVYYAKFATKDTLAIYTKEGTTADENKPHIEISIDHPINAEEMIDTLVHEMAHHNSKLGDASRGFDSYLITELIAAKAEAAELRKKLKKVREVAA